MPFVGGFGSAEMIIFATIALLLFGKRLPEVARSVGSSLMEFKKGMQGIEDEVRTTPSSSNPYATADSSASRPTADDNVETVSAPRFEPPADA